MIRLNLYQYTNSNNKCGFAQKNAHYKKSVLNNNYLYKPAECITHHTRLRKSLPLKTFKKRELTVLQ